MIDPVGAEALEETRPHIHTRSLGPTRSQNVTSLAGFLRDRQRSCWGGGASPELCGELVDGGLPLVGGELSPLQHVPQLLQVAERVGQLAAHRV